MGKRAGPGEGRAPTAKRKFASEEDEVIRRMVRECGPDAWSAIADSLVSRSARQCRERWKHYLAPGLNIGPWAPHEDVILREQFAIFGPKWSAIREALPGRSDVAVKNRWALLSKATTRPAAQPIRMAQPPPADTASTNNQKNDSLETAFYAFPLSPVDDPISGEWGFPKPQDE